MRLHPNDIAAIAAQIADLMQLFPPVTQRWVGIDEAARFADLSKKRLKQLAQEGKVIGYPDPDHGLHRWTFDLASIYRYKMAPVRGRIDLENNILDFLKKQGK